jgi:phosphogluconate dehydratase
VVTEKAIVNGIVGLLATGGSTNHTLHLVAMARSAGILIDWDDFAELSAPCPCWPASTPTASRREPLPRRRRHGLSDARTAVAGCCMPTCTTIMGHGLAAYTQEPWLNDGHLAWRDAPASNRATKRCCARPAAPSAPTAACACCKATWDAAW